MKVFSLISYTKKPYRIQAQKYAKYADNPCVEMPDFVEEIREFYYRLFLETIYCKQFQSFSALQISYPKIKNDKKGTEWHYFYIVNNICNPI